MNTSSYIAMVSVLLCSGCPLFYDIDSAQLSAPDSARPLDGGADVPVVPDLAPDLPVMVEVGIDASSDLEVADESTPVDFGPGGMVCPDAVALDGTCHLVAQDCPASQVCEVGLLMPGAQTGCRDRAAASTYDLDRAAACDPGGTRRCRDGLLCRDGACEQYCYTETAVGCAPDEYCAPLDATNLPGVGWCTTSCP